MVGWGGPLRSPSPGNAQKRMGIPGQGDRKGPLPASASTPAPTDEAKVNTDEARTKVDRDGAVAREVGVRDIVQV